jgi:hypothetical protein
MPTGRSAIGDARLAKEQALARLRQLQTGQLEGRLLDRYLVEATWATAFSSLRDRALALSDRIAQRGANRPAEELRQIVTEEVRDLLDAVASGRF